MTSCMPSSSSSNRRFRLVAVLVPVLLSVAVGAAALGAVLTNILGWADWLQFGTVVVALAATVVQTVVELRRQTRHGGDEAED